jgi:hypothetical protein
MILMAKYAKLIFTLIALAAIGTCAMAQKNAIDHSTPLMIPGSIGLFGDYGFRK